MSDQNNRKNGDMVKAGNPGLAPVAANSLVLRGLADLAQGPLLKVVKAIQTDPNDSHFFYYRGKALLEKEDYDNAMKDFDEAIRLDPKNALFFYHRGTAWLGEKDYDTAIKDFGEAIRLDPKNALLYNSRGIAWYFKKDFDQAIEDFDQAIRLDPNNWNAYRRRSFVLLSKKDFDNAIKRTVTRRFYSVRKMHSSSTNGGKLGWVRRTTTTQSTITTRSFGSSSGEICRISPSVGGSSAWMGKKDFDKASEDLWEGLSYLSPRILPPLLVPISTALLKAGIAP